ncbi:MAG: MerR family transcriptional regulator [Solirubrobacteraceae bacterium]
MNALADALLRQLDDEALDALAERLAPRLRPPPEDRWFRGAESIACYLDCPISRVYALVAARRIPVERDGSSLIARRSELDAWLRSGGGKRP